MLLVQELKSRPMCDCGGVRDCQSSTGNGGARRTLFTHDNDDEVCVLLICLTIHSGESTFTVTTCFVMACCALAACTLASLRG
jgi:hypothetical protein